MSVAAPQPHAAAQSSASFLAVFDLGAALTLCSCTAQVMRDNVSTLLLRRRYEEDMDERLDSSIKRILLQNRRAVQELQLHMDESKLLASENKILMEERKKLLQARATTGWL
jgi:hypothetical protein